MEGSIVTITRADWLPTVLRDAGCPVRTYSGWASRGPAFTNLRAVVWHHDASPPGDSPGVPAYMLREIAAGKPGAQLWVDRAGMWHVLASGVVYHAGRVLAGMPGNSSSLGVETDHTTGEEWPTALLDGLRHGTAAILAALGRDEGALHFHKTICDPPGRKSDPDALDLTAERARVRRLLAAPPAALLTPTIPAPPDMEDVMARLVKAPDKGALYATDGMRKWYVPSPTARDELKSTGVYGDGKVYVLSQATLDAIPMVTP